MDTSEQTILDETPKRVARRRRSVEEKRRIVEETLEAGASVARVARRHAVNANQVFYWRKKYREGRLGKNQSSKLLPVTLSDIHGVFRHKFVGLIIQLYFNDGWTIAAERLCRTTPLRTFRALCEALKHIRPQNKARIFGFQPQLQSA